MPLSSGKWEDANHKAVYKICSSTEGQSKASWVKKHASP